MAGKQFWTYDKVLSEIKRVMELQGIDHLPRYNDLRELTGIGANALQRVGGYKKISEDTGIPLAPVRRKTHYEKAKKTYDYIDHTKPRPSQADKIEAEMRKQGLSYKDWQTADTLKRVEGMAW